MENQFASPAFLAKPPRNVPLLVRLRLILGGFCNQFGWLFFGFGMIFVWIFGLSTDPMALYDFSGELETVKGVIVKQTKTRMSEGGSKHTKGTPIYLNDYEFDYDGQTYAGASYTVGQLLTKGIPVTIEFPNGRPNRSRIQNMRTAPFPVFALFVVLFPIIGLCFVVFGFWQGSKVCKLLKFGEYTTGKLISKEATSTRINDQPVYRMSFEFQTQSGESKIAVAKTHQTEKLEDDVSEALLYDPLFPEKATLLDHLPGAPRVDNHGQISASSPITTLLCLIIPTISIVGHSLAFYFIFLK